MSRNNGLSCAICVLIQLTASFVSSTWTFTSDNCGVKTLLMASLTAVKIIVSSFCCCSLIECLLAHSVPSSRNKFCFCKADRLCSVPLFPVALPSEISHRLHTVLSVCAYIFQQINEFKRIFGDEVKDYVGMT